MVGGKTSEETHDCRVYVWRYGGSGEPNFLPYSTLSLSNASLSFAR
jgi:hypothetical protein